MTETLQQLVGQAAAIAGFGLCSYGHNWVMEGARRCPRDADACSQAVYRCARCGEWDYGYVGGPGWEDCIEPCTDEAAQCVQDAAGESVWRELAAAQQPGPIGG